MSREYYNLTNPQKSIYFTEQMYRGTSITNVSGTARINTQIDFEKLKEASKQLFKNNEALRGKFTIVNNLPVQYFEEYKDVEIDIVDIADEIELKNLINKLVKTPFSEPDKEMAKMTLFRFPDGTGGCNIVHSHLISDAWTTTLECSELIEYYEALLGNKEIYKDPNYTYKKFIEEEEKYYNSEKYLRDQDYWFNKFDTLPELSTTNIENSENKNCTAERKKFILSNEQSNRIIEFCSKNRVSVYCFFLAIYSIYLSRINNLNTIVLGTPLLNRKNIIEKKTFGMFVNTIPVTIKINEDTNISSLFEEISKEVLSIMRHQKFSYFELLEYIRNKYNINRGLYDVIFSFQNAKTKSNTSNIPYKAEWDFNGYISETLNIHVSDIDNTNKLNIFYDYQIAKHSDIDILRLHNRIMYIAEQILNNNQIIINEIDIVPENEKSILNSINMKNVNYPKDKTIVDLFEEQVNKTPENIAVKCNNISITYNELNEKANQLAKFLIKKGVYKGDKIAIRLNKSIEMIVGILAIIKAGATYVPIDLSYPKERIEFIIKDSESKLLLTNKKSNTYNDIIECCEIDNINVSEYDKSNIKLKRHVNDTLYIIYTSGSTGIPKGAMLSHKNVVRLLKNDKFQFDFNETDIWTMFHSVAFDFSVWEMYGALLFGGKLILVPEETAKNPIEFLELLKNENVTILNQTPTYFYNLLDAELKKEDANLKVRYIIFGGEALKPNLIKGWKTKYNFTKLINMYGITETTVHVTYKELLNDNLESSDSNIGKPIPTLKVYILDEKLRQVPVGIEGEICVTGDGVCKGYLNRENLNKIKFIESPFESNSILYRSADSGYIGEDGDLHYIGRIDTQVKVRGFRVELGEIETKLLRHPLIDKCVVLADKKSDKDSHLVAYIVCKKNVKIDELKEYLKPLVPPYMIPNYFVKLKKIPLNSNGKVDRKYLKTLNYTIEQNQEYVKPRNEFEEILAEITQKDLNIDVIGIDDDIFDLGADSLSLMRITSELLEYNYEINIQAFYENKTIRNISDYYYANNSNITNIKELEQNLYFDMQNNKTLTKLHFSNILITGATGFLGIHILYDLLKKTNANLYCLIRDKHQTDGKIRLIEKLKFYFPKESKEIIQNIDKRIFIIKGDISKEKLDLKEEEYKILGYKIDTIVHSAAIVNHYGKKEIFNMINVDGTKHIIEFCKEFHIRLNHISTTSVSADFISGKKYEETFFENSLYIGQPYSKNIYVKTKFEAEYLLWKEKDSDLEFTIYRMGNITSRASDGKFQENDYQNAFLNRMISLCKIGASTEELLNYEFDMSPVDFCSNFITESMQYESSYKNVFHVLNKNKITLKDIFNALKIKDIKILPSKELYEYIKSKTEKLGLINDITSKSLSTKKIEINSDFSNEYFNKLGLEWLIIDSSYIKKYISLGDKNEENKKN